MSLERYPRASLFLQGHPGGSSSSRPFFDGDPSGGTSSEPWPGVDEDGGFGDEDDAKGASGARPSYEDYVRYLHGR